ncbi:MAG: 4Fe-4S binding protein [Candidatus Latescibacterota bacterium]|nr:MAG: 4Fe-4S binding protein [Candidatus Latescibacterota bacterium]
MANRSSTRMPKTEKASNGGRLVIDHDECAGCGACPAVCHSLALRLDALTLEIEYELCDNCSLCVIVCPTGALSVVEKHTCVRAG